MAKHVGSPSRERNARGQGERLREELLEAATSLLLEHGDSERVSIRSVTAQALVSPMAFYMHFADKQALIDAVVGRAFDELRGYVQAAKSSHADEPGAQLRAACRAYLDFALERPGLYRLLFGIQRTHGGYRFGEDEGDEGDNAFRDLVDGVSAVLPDGVDAWPVAVNVWALMHGLASLQPAIPGFPWPDTDALLAAALDGLVFDRASGAPRPPASGSA